MYSSREPHTVLTNCSLGHMLKVFSYVTMADSRKLRYKIITFVEVLLKPPEHWQLLQFGHRLLPPRYAAFCSTLAKYGTSLKRA
jgi:hypothetical protein